MQMKESNVTLYLIRQNTRSREMKNEHGHVTDTMVNGDRYLAVIAKDNKSVMAFQFSPEIYAAKWRTSFKSFCSKNDALYRVVSNDTHFLRPTNFFTQ